MPRWEDMSEKQKKDDFSAHYGRMALVLSGAAMLLSISGFISDIRQFVPEIVVVTVLATMAIILTGFREHENPYFLWGAFAVAIGAVMLQYWMFALIVLVIFALLIAILNVFGVPF